MRTRLRAWPGADARATDDRGWTYNLAIFRLVFLGGVALPFALSVARWAERILPGLPPEAWKPVSFYALLPLDLVRDPRLAYTLALADLALIALAFVGVFTRWTLGLATLLSLYVLGLPQNQGKVDHYHHVVWFMALLAVGPSAHVLSVDALRAAVRGADAGVVERPAPAGTALRTLRFIWALFGLVYLAPGLAKLASPGAGGWTEAENLRALFWSEWFGRGLYGTGFAPATWLAELPAPVLTLAGVGVIVFQVSFVVLVFVRPLRPWLACAGVAFHRISKWAIGITFWFLIPAYAALLDWAAIARSLRRRWSGPPLVVLYDGDCRLCRRAIALVRSLDLADAIDPVAARDERRRDYRFLTDEMLARDLHVVAGAWTAHGYDAYVRIADRVPALWPLALLMRVPPVAVVGRRIYRRVADARACAVGAPAPRGSRDLVRGSWVTAVGLVLVAGQATVSGGERLSAIAGHDRARAAWSRFRWPFDHYPAFTANYRKDERVWEPRIVLPDTAEARISPQAFQRAFGTPAKAKILADGMLRITDPRQRRAQSLDLLRSLWSRERPDVRAAAVEVRTYVVTYRLGASRPTIAAEQLLDRFTPAELQHQTPPR